MDLLLNNVHETSPQLIDMMTLMQGFNSEVYATLLSRTSKPLDAEQKKELHGNRKSAIEWLQEYLAKVSKGIEDGESLWRKEFHICSKTR